jgi:hypothetical protein
MKEYRENPESEANTEATKQTRREIFALKMMQAANADAKEDQKDCTVDAPISKTKELQR